MKIIKKLSLVAASLVFMGAVLAPAAVLAVDANTSAVCDGLALTGGQCGAEAAGTGVNGTIKLVINLLSMVVGVISVIMIIIGGLKYVMSSGDSNNVNSAKNTILYALVGLVIVALAQVIVKFVLHNVK